MSTVTSGPDKGIRSVILRDTVSRALHGKSVEDVEIQGHSITALVELICLELDLLDPETMRFK